ncbi:MAG: hypothetical protein KGK10_02225 [Rhodospirillales bacterium]|nr:hypothetical protein [Rhodospirillales bacterium]
MNDNKGAAWERYQDNLRKDWSKNVFNLAERHIASLEEMRFHNPTYFRGANFQRDLEECGLSKIPLLPSRNEGVGTLPLRERIADLWYRLAYP